MSQNIAALTDDSFEESVIKADGPVLVDFWAEWCAPCRSLAPLLEELAEEYAGKLTVAKLDTDGNPDTPANYGIRGIPTLILFKDGKAAATKVGAMSKADLTAFINENL